MAESFAYWQQRLASKLSGFASQVKSASRVYGNLKGWIDKYHGGMPSGFAAAIAYWESGGNFGSVGDAGLGEVGFYQVTASFPPKVGVDPAVRKDPEGNVFLGLLEYQVLVAQLKQRYPGLIVLGSDDSWKVARTAFQIGYGGTRTLIEHASPTPGHVYDALVAYVDKTGGVALGSQEAGKVWYRVKVVEHIWRVGRAVKADRSTWPITIPSPVPYRIDPALLFSFKSSRGLPPAAWGVLALAAVGLGYGIYRRRQR